ncbi:TetR/AcrR family transcriptional regulator [Rhodococcus koreensis]
MTASPDEHEEAIRDRPHSRATPARARRNPALVQADILEVATAEFAEKGLSGASVNEIAEKTQTTKRMIYYYFGGKEGLYTAVLERNYKLIRELEHEVDLEHAEPVDALRLIAELTFDHHDTHRAYVRLVSGENMMKGKYIRQSDEVAGLGMPVLAVLEDVLRRGQEAGVFRRDVEAIDVHMLINSVSLFRISNQYTFDALFQRNLAADELRSHLRTVIGDVTVRYVCI